MNPVSHSTLHAHHSVFSAWLESYQSHCSYVDVCRIYSTIEQVLRDAGVGLKSVYVSRRAAALRNADGIDGIVQRYTMLGSVFFLSLCDVYAGPLCCGKLFWCNKWNTGQSHHYHYSTLIAQLDEWKGSHLSKQNC